MFISPCPWEAVLWALSPPERSRAEQRGGQGKHSPSQRAVASACETCARVFLTGCPAEQTPSARELRAVTEMRQMSLVTASTCGGGHGMPNRQRQVPGEHKQQRACVLQSRVVRDEGKGLALVGCEEEEEGRQSSPCLLGCRAEHCPASSPPLNPKNPRTAKRNFLQHRFSESQLSLRMKNLPVAQASKI